jgi:hypothetical protein
MYPKKIKTIYSLERMKYLISGTISHCMKIEFTFAGSLLALLGLISSSLSLLGWMQYMVRACHPIWYL